jgi:hypothetical protein
MARPGEDRNTAAAGGRRQPADVISVGVRDDHQIDLTGVCALT